MRAASDAYVYNRRVTSSRSGCETSCYLYTHAEVCVRVCVRVRVCVCESWIYESWETKGDDRNGDMNGFMINWLVIVLGLVDRQVD